MSCLIYDIGMHDGQDSAFYLANGFRVVAVEADPELCQEAEERFGPFIAGGRLTIVNRAVVAEPGPVTFYRSTMSGWGTVVDEWNRHNAARGVAADSIAIEGITLADLVADYGEPFYIKVDIEGMDRIVLESLAKTAVRPPYLSLETSFARSMKFGAIELDFEALLSLGYRRFKIVDQRVISPGDSGPSGPFGEDAPGEWLSAEAALASFRKICRKNWLPLLLYRNMRIFLYYSKIMNRLFGRLPNLSWYDIHAKHCSVD